MAEDESQRNTESARFISEFGAAATGFMVPVTSDKPSELRRSLIALYERTGANLYLQDYPAPTGIHITVEDLLRAVDGLPFIAAIKCESAPTFWRISELSRYQRDIVMMSGLGGIGLIDDLMCGASAVACGISRPEHIVAATTAWLAGRRSEAAHQVNSIAGLISFETQAQTSIGIRKEHWRRQGVIEHSTVRRPTLPYPSNLDACSSLHGFVDRPRIHPL
jgi:4-hydroxy-tetrahydrodipicolinate synthase